VLSFLLATVVDIVLLTVSETLQGHHCDNRPIPAMASRLPFSAIRLCHFREILPNILVNNSTWGVAGQKFCHQTFCLTMGNMSTQFACLTATFFVRWGVLRGQKKPLRGSQPPNLQKGYPVGPWTLLGKICSLIGRKL